MDTYGISHSSQYVEMLQQQQLRLREAQTRSGQRPTLTARTEVILQFQLNLMRSQSRAADRSNENAFIKTSFVPLPYTPCILPLSSLQKIMISELVLETHHRGSYLLVRTVTPQDRMTAVMAIVEDEKRDVLMAQLYHQEDDTDCPVEDVLVEGMVLIFKEPYLKMTSDGNYTRALTCSPTPEETHTLRLNRSLAFLKTCQFDAALSDAETTIVATTHNTKPAEKGLFRKAEALYSLGRYRECCEVLKQLRLEYPNNGTAKTQLTRAIRRLAEQTNGKYVFKQLYAEANRLRPPLLDYATYVGAVAIRASGTRGRGLFTTKPVKAGDLLFCEKAFTHAFLDKEEGRGSSLTMLIDMENGGTMGSQSDLINMTVRKLFQNPSLMTIITDLHHGSYQPVNTTEVNGTPVIDTFLIRRIIALNSFGCPLTTLTSHGKAHHQNLTPNPIITTHPHPEEKSFYSCGLWPFASHINHSCVSNARRAFIGDFMIARATRDLSANTEITWWYQPPGANNYAKQKEKLGHWGFECDCVLCGDEKGTEEVVRGKRRGIAEGLGRYVEGLGVGKRVKKEVVVGRMEAAVKAMGETYGRPASEVPRLAVWEALQKPLMKLVQTKQLRAGQMVKLILMAFEALGFVIEGGASGTVVVRQWGLLMDAVVDCWMFLRDLYCIVAPELVKTAEGYARTAYRMVFGEDETFEAFGDT